MYLWCHYLLLRPVQCSQFQSSHLAVPDNTAACWCEQCRASSRVQRFSCAEDAEVTTFILAKAAH